jgi:hypothetical protein
MALAHALINDEPWLFTKDRGFHRIANKSDGPAPGPLTFLKLHERAGRTPIVMQPAGLEPRQHIGLQEAPKSLSICRGAFVALRANISTPRRR